jgi:hypothetical protein
LYLHLLGRCSATWATPPSLFFFFFFGSFSFWMWSCIFAWGWTQTDPPTYSLPRSWNYSCTLPHLALLIEVRYC